MKEINLTQGKKAIVDDDMYEYLSQWKWCYSHGYAIRQSSRVNGKQHTIWMHRQIMATPKGMETDHIDRNKLNNQYHNLRICTRSQNTMNTGVHVDNTSGFKGVTWHKRKLGWQAQIRVNGK